MADELYKKQIVRWVDADGKRCRPHAPGATRRVEESRKWYGTIAGKPTPLSSDKTVAKRLFRQLAAKADQASFGLTDPHEEYRKLPLTEHLDDFKRALVAKGNTNQHIQLTVSRVRAMLDATHTVLATDLDLAKVNEWLATVRRDRDPITPPPGKATFSPLEIARLLGVSTQSVREAVKRHCLTVTGKGNGRRLTREAVEYLCHLAARGVGAESVNHYVRAIRAFMRWLVVKAKRLPSNPLGGLELIDSKADRRHARRELTTAELCRLLAAARLSKRIFWGLSGEDRYHLYACACGTGFRAGGLAGLTPERFDLNAEVPTVTLSVRRDKSRRGKVHPLPEDIAELMRAYLTGKPEGEPIWGTGWAKRGAEMLRADLADAGIPYVVEGADGPLFADFHALRHSYITALGRGGVDLRTAQELAGHSTPVLTGHYSHRSLHDLARAVEKLPTFLPDDKKGTEVKPTRSDDVACGCSMVAGPVDPLVRLLASPDTKEVGNGEVAALPQPLASSALGTSCHPLASGDVKRPLPDLNRGVTDLQSVALAAWRRGHSSDT